MLCFDGSTSECQRTTHFRDRALGISSNQNADRFGMWIMISSGSSFLISMATEYQKRGAIGANIAVNQVADRRKRHPWSVTSNLSSSRRSEL